MLNQLLLAFLAAFLLTSCHQASETEKPAAPAAPAGEWVGTGPQRLWTQTYRSAQLTDHPTLLLVLHGDAPFNRPAYQYALARQVAQANANVVAVGLLRPGYTDPAGHQSAGERGEATGDNYTPAVIDAVAAALTTLKARYQAGRVVVAGHSGGAAITADLLGRHPGLADAALLASCPCNVAAWRTHMKRQVGGPVWDLPTQSISPEQVVARIPAATRVTLLTGTADTIAPPALTKEYYGRLQRQGISAKLRELPAQGHDLFLAKDVQQEVSQLLK
ncbi:alpha/beta hydrolase family protein [Hymenobacter cellulosivorans]|uniref:Alpha/beta hydrolase n=1 Tax=Hymenobacter cellulosivorans TaxID=2932249 RepID=A0ABY4FCE9_9BACT|nr:prolyl oligopeptidase family serine peptidase [Hymenobacter cellulosivorans]UOQ54337.1 alpha/beta hydrolase [Hymenobacter cellulosivorans]